MSLRALLPSLLFVTLLAAAHASAKRVALVFDDGPVPADAGPLLAVLAQEKVRVTFSLVGDRVAEHPATARAIAAAGHEIANHSQTHAHARDLDDAALDREVAEAQRKLAEVTGTAPRWYWPPFLEVDDRVRAAVTRAGLTLYEPHHLVVSKDYDRSVPAAEIFRLATTDVRDGAVILFHEWRTETREQLSAILAELRRQGCEFLTFSELHAALNPAAVSFASDATGFPLVRGTEAAPLFVSASDWPGVRRAADDLRRDVERVTGRVPALATGAPQGREVVILGTFGKSALVDDLVTRGKLDVAAIRGRWEAFQIETIEQPWPGTERALVIAGSDKRGTIYGIYELSARLGVSPWYWWADVPVIRREALVVSPGRVVEPGPTVKYRGIFLNDEAPALTGWAQEKFGGLNAQFYARVFELMLRLRANYLWPAMWNNAFNEDDPENPRLADEFGIVMGTSHHEPMIRSQQEWKRHGRGPWDYAQNAGVLRQFWADGIRRNREFESIVTIGMRGDGDEAMSEDTNVTLLEQIVADQRKILRAETGRPAEQVPQLWALYKEVQAYYERGMRVPDDVTLLWCDDNWSNIRRLPTAGERARPGGAGVYFHFDYVGGPRNYKWLNTVPLTKIWEQMHLARAYGADRIWIVNVGDLKPMEFPIEFFLRFAWRPDAIGYDQLPDYSRQWAARQFGPEHAGEIAALINGYTKLNSRRKPELLAPETFSVVNYREAERVLAEWRDLEARAERLEKKLPAVAHAAFFQLVQHPITAGRIVNELHITAGRNRLSAIQGRASTNALAARARELFQADARLQERWDALLEGKWRHLMDQTHLGYVTWQQPVRNVMPAVSEVQVPHRAEIGLAVEGDPAARPGDYPIPAVAKLPPLSPLGPASRWFDVFSRGALPATFSIEATEPWLRVSQRTGELGPDTRIEVSVDWAQVPAETREARIVVRGAEQVLTIVVPIDPRAAAGPGFVEVDGHLTIDAPHFHRAVPGDGSTWKTLPNFGRGAGAVTTYPTTAPASALSAGSPRLEYDVVFRSAGDFNLELHCAPTWEFQPGEPREIAVSLDDQPPQRLKLGITDTNADWERAVADSVKKLTARLRVERPGAHVLKVWRVTSAVVIERIVIDTGGLRPSYLGPPESGQGKR
jgi:peptidoglycan/xylan/chitin deacetylase (PgdA/CDA1 family)